MNKDFFDNTVDKAKDMFDVARRKADEVISVEKLKYTISSLNSKITNDYKKLGKMYYESVKSGDAVSDEASDIIADITEKQQLADQAKAQIAEIKNKKICPVCGAGVGKKSSFCSECGAKFYDGEE